MGKQLALKLSIGLLGASAVELLLFAAAAGLALFKGGQYSVSPLVPLRFFPADLVLVIAMLATVFVYWQFYYYVYGNEKESDCDYWVSLGLPAWFFVQNNFVFLDGARPYRFFFLSVPLFVGWYKNERILKRYQGTFFDPRVRDWREKARWTAAWTVISAFGFMLLVEDRWHNMIFGLEFQSSAPIGRHFKEGVSAMANFSALAIATRSAFRSGKYFKSEGKRVGRYLGSIPVSNS